MTAGSTYQRSQVKSVWCTFRFLLQQKRSVSVSDGLNEGLVSRATGSRSTRPGVCVYYQSPCVYSGLHPVPPSPPLLSPASPARPPSNTNGHIYRSEPRQLPLHPACHKTSPPSLHKSCTHTLQCREARAHTLSEHIALSCTVQACEHTYATHR